MYFFVGTLRANLVLQVNVLEHTKYESNKAEKLYYDGKR